MQFIHLYKRWRVVPYNVDKKELDYFAWRVKIFLEYPARRTCQMFSIFSEHRTKGNWLKPHRYFSAEKNFLAKRIIKLVYKRIPPPKVVRTLKVRLKILLSHILKSSFSFPLEI